MKQLSDEALKNAASEFVSDFHRKRLESLDKLNLKTVLKRKNPYLFYAKNMRTAETIVEAILSAYLSSQEETLFGETLERLAIFVASEVFDGKKTSVEGIDLEFTRNSIIYMVSIKSGPNWANSSQTKRMESNFQKARKIGGTNTNPMSTVFIEGCCYGSTDVDKGNYRKVCGQVFWELISGRESLYVDIIEPLGEKAYEKNQAFYDSYNEVKKRFCDEFNTEFCHADGTVLWDKFLDLTSARRSR